MITTFGRKTFVLGGICAAVLVGGAGAAAHARPVTTTVRGGRIAKSWDIQEGAGGMRFDPQNLTIQVGDTVNWVIAMGNHNVQFWKDSVPAAAVPILQKAMQNDTLWVPRMPTVGQKFTIAFTDAPKGVYKFFCTPHLMRGMVGSLTVQ